MIKDFFYQNKTHGFFILIFLFNALLLDIIHNQKPSFKDVPPAVPPLVIQGMALGDPFLGYRLNAVKLQNIGYQPGYEGYLTAYNYVYLKDWFMVQMALDERSEYTPNLAAFYFGAVKDSVRLEHIVTYLEKVGERNRPGAWRWLAQAVSLARYEMNNPERALTLAYKLAAHPDPDVADWARQMPAFVLNAQGKHDLAFDVMMGILSSKGNQMDMTERNAILHYICTNLFPYISSEKSVFCENMDFEAF